MKKAISKRTDLKKLIKRKRESAGFYARFRNAIIEVKASLAGKIELKDAETWLREI
ncbi:MAG: hypothetical protein V4577_11305 [Bacteroidota bacterium]